MKNYIHLSFSSVIAMSIGIVSSSPALAQDANTAASEAQARRDEIVVTGTRRANRTVTETSVPVDVFDSQLLATQAPSDMNNVLRNLVPSFNVATFTLSDGSSFIRPPNLRGLPPDEILVLVNGKRRHRAALVQIWGGSLASGAQGPDLAQIPTIAVDRIEVLRDGAAAQYGSDAIAGVINYTLKRAADGISVNGRYGQYYRGDGENLQLSANVGLPLGPDGFVNASFEHIRQGITAPGGQRVGAYLLSQQQPDLDIENPANSIGDPRIRAYRGFVNAGLDVGENGQVYAFGNYGESRSQIAFNWRQPVDLFGPDVDGNGNTTLYEKSGVFNDIYLDRLPDGTYDVNGRRFNFASVFPAGFAPLFRGHITDMSGAAGYRDQTSFGLNFDLSASFGMNRIDYNMSRTANPSMGPDSPTSFYLGRLEQRETNFNADFSYELDAGLASPITIAFGGEHRREAYAIELGDQNSYKIGSYYYQELSNGETTSQSVGSNGFPGFGPDSTVDNSRSSYAAYLDVEGDVLAGLTLGGAIRYENFSDFGGTTNVKGTARYEFSDALAVRGAASTGFRAPTPGQLYTNNVATNFRGADPIETATVPPTAAAAKYFGAVPLTPEKSTNFSVGFVFTPSPRLTLTVDAYEITVKDRIGYSQIFQVDVPDDPAQTAINRAALRDLGVVNWATLGEVQYFTNGFATRTRGVDVVLNHNFATETMGRFQTTLAANYNKNKVTRFEEGILSPERIGNIEHMNPKFRANMTETWTLGDFTVLGRAAYYHKWKDFAQMWAGGNAAFGSEFTFDLEVSYQMTDNIRLAVGGENIFNNYPDKDRRSTGTPDQNWYRFTDAQVDGNRYPGSSPFGVNGGFWYVRANLNF